MNLSRAIWITTLFLFTFAFSEEKKPENTKTIEIDYVQAEVVHTIIKDSLPQLEGRVTKVDKNKNTLTIKDGKESLAILELIKAIDVRPIQIQLQGKVYEVLNGEKKLLSAPIFYTLNNRRVTINITDNIELELIPLIIQPNDAQEDKK